jgi:transposase
MVACLKQDVDVIHRVLYHASKEKHDMRRPALIHQWLSRERLQAWVRKAGTREEYQKRLAIWMTAMGPFPAHRVASLLVVSKQAVWLWVSQYNRLGPDGLLRRGRGGRHRAYLSLTEEAALLESLQKRTQRGELTTARQVQEKVSKVKHIKVSISYIYRLFDRIGWRRLGARARHSKVSLHH